LKVIFDFYTFSCMPPHDASHTRIALASHPACVVEQCRCGQIHLTIGGVTLRLERDAFLSIADVCGSAARVARARDHVANPARRSLPMALSEDDLGLS
jgi:hypothetical protein